MLGDTNEASVGDFHHISVLSYHCGEGRANDPQTRNTYNEKEMKLLKPSSPPTPLGKRYSSLSKTDRRRLWRPRPAGLRFREHWLCISSVRFISSWRGGGGYNQLFCDRGAGCNEPSLNRPPCLKLPVNPLRQDGNQVCRQLFRLCQGAVTAVHQEHGSTEIEAMKWRQRFWRCGGEKEVHDRSAATLRKLPAPT